MWSRCPHPRQKAEESVDEGFVDETVDEPAVDEEGLTDEEGTGDEPIRPENDEQMEGYGF